MNMAKHKNTVYKRSLDTRFPSHPGKPEYAKKNIWLCSNVYVTDSYYCCFLWLEYNNKGGKQIYGGLICSLAAVMLTAANSSPVPKNSQV